MKGDAASLARRPNAGSTPPRASRVGRARDRHRCEPRGSVKRAFDAAASLSVAIVAALDAGYCYGVEVVTLGENVLSLNGLSLGLRLGLSVAL